MSLLLLSPCFYPSSSPAELMVDSARAHGLNVRLYGVGQDFIPHGADAQVFRLWELMKPKQLADYALITDCRDVLFLANEEEILRKLDQFPSPVVMSTERNCWPPDPEIQNYFYGRDAHGYDYINAGMYIGKWDYVVTCLEHLLNKYRGQVPGADNSQGWWMWAKMRGELRFDLDYACEIFHSMTGGADRHLDDMGNGRVYNRLTNSMPCSLHFNGNPGNDEPQIAMYRRLFR
jgi:hypothetical protein